MLKEYECFICLKLFEREEIKYDSVINNVAVVKVQDVCCSQECKDVADLYDKKIYALEELKKVFGQDVVIVERDDKLFYTFVLDKL